MQWSMDQLEEAVELLRTAEPSEIEEALRHLQREATSVQPVALGDVAGQTIPPTGEQRSVVHFGHLVQRRSSAALQIRWTDDEQLDASSPRWAEDKTAPRRFPLRYSVAIRGSMLLIAMLSGAIIYLLANGRQQGPEPRITAIRVSRDPVAETLVADKTVAAEGGTDEVRLVVSAVIKAARGVNALQQATQSSGVEQR